MVWLIILFAALLILGPAYSLLPSAKQKKQMSMRREAMGEGIGVELTQIEDPDPNPEKYLTATGKPLDRLLSVAAYRLSRPSPQGWRKPEPWDWALIRSGQSSSDLSSGWQWEEEQISSVAQKPELMEFIRHQVDALPEDVVRVDEKNFTVSVYWHESEAEGVIDQVIDFLKDCVNLDIYTSDTSDTSDTFNTSDESEKPE